MPPSHPFLNRLLARVIPAALLGSASVGAHAFDRVNVLVSHVPVPGPAAPPRFARLNPFGPCGVAVLGDSLLFVDRVHHRVLRLREGRITVFAGNGETGSRIDPDDPLRTALGWPRAVLVLRDQSVLVAHEMGLHDGHPGQVVVRIRTRRHPGQPAVSLFAGNGQQHGGVDPGSALRTTIRCVTDLAEERDGAVLVSDYLRHQVLRVRTDGRVEGVAGTGHPGSHLEPASGPGTQLGYPRGLAVLKDGSILIGDTESKRILRVRDGAVSVFAGATPGAEHPVALFGLQGVAVLPDGSVVILDREYRRAASDAFRFIHVTAGGVSLMAGKDWDGLPLDPQYHPGLRFQGVGFGNFLTALRDGSLVLASACEGLRLLSPPDVLQATLEGLVAKGKAAVRAEDLAVYRQAVQDLAYLCGPASRALRAANHAAHDLGRLEPGRLEPGLQLPPELMKIVQDQASPNGAERLRAQLALRELRRYKSIRLGR